MTLKKVFFLLLFTFLAVSSPLQSMDRPPVADIILMGNLQGKASKQSLHYIASHNPYSIWLLGGNVSDLAFALEKKKNLTLKELFANHKGFFRSFVSPNPHLAVLGNEDFQYGLHGAVKMLRAMRPGYMYILDFIGAKNHENPFLLKYIDILVNGKTLRFMGLGAWEKLYPAKKDVLYRKVTGEIIQEMKEYAASLKKADHTILITHQSFQNDKLLAAMPEVRNFIDLIISNDPASPLFLKEKDCIPIAGSGRHGSHLRKVYFTNQKKTPSYEYIQVWKDEKYKEFLEKQKIKNKNTKKK